MEYKALRRTVELNNLSEGQVIDTKEYIEKLRFFSKYSTAKGTYITDKTYVEYSERGLHYFYYETLIKLLTQLHAEKVLIGFNNGALALKPV